MKNLMKNMINEINVLATQEIKIMEVCGSHTQAISKLGLRSVLSPNIKLLSGPGCPVCVTSEEYIDTVIEMLNSYNVTIVTFGDLLKVKGSKKCLLDEKSVGKDIRIIYSPLDLIEIAINEINKKFIFLAVGFETTAPIIALTIKRIEESKISNIYFFTSIKLMDPILHYILEQDNQINGLICPGHVASIKGADYFRFISEDYNIPAVICGFEDIDILGGIYYLVKEISKNENDKKESKKFLNLYIRCVKPEGNDIANKLLEEVFTVSNDEWRGIGNIKDSALVINKRYEKFDAKSVFKVIVRKTKQDKVCSCGEILLGRKTPFECPLFGKVCNPTSPVGPCMVSSEGSCAISYKSYGGNI